MSDPGKPLTLTELQTFWSNCPWGVIAIGANGDVRAVNGAVEQHAAIAGKDWHGMSEATLVAKLGASGLEHSRVETAGELRAIHFLHSITARSGQERNLSRLAEELREPLASIYGFAELLLTQSYDEDTRLDLTETLVRQVELMSGLINERLDISRTRNLP
jgi:signal transduction histidine kinase